MLPITTENIYWMKILGYPLMKSKCKNLIRSNFDPFNGDNIKQDASLAHGIQLPKLNLRILNCFHTIRWLFWSDQSSFYYKSKSSYVCSSVLSWASICHSILCTLASRSKQTTNLVKKIHENSGFIVSELVDGSCEQDNHFSLTNMSVKIS